MPGWVMGDGGSLAVTAAKAVLMYAVAVIALRAAHRRTLAQWTPIDFAAAVATGAIVGRTAIASGQSFAIGAVALLTILASHWVVTMLRFHDWFGRLVDHRVRVLVDHGRLRRDQLRMCGITEGDLIAHLREHGVWTLASLRYVLYETKGELTIVREDQPAGEGELLEAGLRAAAPR